MTVQNVFSPSGEIEGVGNERIGREWSKMEVHEWNMEMSHNGEKDNKRGRMRERKNRGFRYVSMLYDVSICFDDVIEFGSTFHEHLASHVVGKNR